MASRPSPRACAIAGGGPAGMMLGFLLARAGVDVVVLEKHADFLRDFRGDTIHPSTLEIMHELGLLDEFLKRPHQEVRELAGLIGDERSSLPISRICRPHCRFIALMPQWDFLDFLAEQAQPLSGLSSQDAGRGRPTSSWSGGRVLGLHAETPEGPLEIRADLVVGADGRHSMCASSPGSKVEDFGAPMDVLWFRLSKRPKRRRADARPHPGGAWSSSCSTAATTGNAPMSSPKAASTCCAPRGSRPSARRSWRSTRRFADRVQEIASWDDVKLLTVTVDRLKRW